MASYLVSCGDAYKPGIDLCVVVADNEEQAKELFLTNYALKCDRYREQVRIPAVNMCFAETFFIVDGEHIFNIENYEDIDTDKLFRTNVYKFFDDRKDYAELFIKEYTSGKILMDIPDDMIIYIVIHSCDDWFGDISVIDIADITIGGDGQ